MSFFVSLSILFLVELATISSATLRTFVNCSRKRPAGLTVIACISLAAIAWRSTK